MKRNALILALMVTVVTCFLSSSCGEHSNQREDATNNMVEKNGSIDLDAGRALYMSNCYSCHNANAQDAARLAPTTAHIQATYKARYPTEESFVREMTGFLKQVKIEEALLKNAVEKHGLMPQLSFSDEEWKSMAQYIHRGTFEDIKGQGQPTAIEEMSPTEKGLHYAQSTKSQLGKNLMRALQDGGPHTALPFCNTRAIPLTDSMAQHFGVEIKRVSDQPRNPNNQANEDELVVINSLNAQLGSEGKAKPILKDEGAFFRFYAPIVTNGMCLQCHGVVGEDITPETTKLIDDLYPSDEAKGYAANELRGIWSITFPKM